MICYVMNETNDVFGIKLGDNSVKVVKCPMFDASARKYNSENRLITKYWPV